MDLNAELLIAACSDDSASAGITITTRLEPLGGSGSPVKPATYAGGQFQADRRWWGADGDRHPVDVLVIDNEPSQANRLEAALEQRRAELGLPEIALDLRSLGSLPPHLPQRISSFRFPHRNADAYLRDAVLNETRFLDTEIGRALFASTADNPLALLEWYPTALLLGFWQSHLGKTRSQARLARAWTSEIIGIEPATSGVRRMGMKGDPLNLNIDERVVYDEDAPEEWRIAPADEAGATRRGDGKKKEKLSEIGHGQVPVPADRQPLAGVSFGQVVQRATVSFASLRRVRPTRGAAEARALLASLGLVAHVVAFGRPFSLRSGADLRPVHSDWIWLGESESLSVAPPTVNAASALFHECVSRAEAAGLPVGSRWAADPLVVTPAPNLAKAIRDSWPV